MEKSEVHVRTACITCNGKGQRALLTKNKSGEQEQVGSEACPFCERGFRYAWVPLCEAVDAFSFAEDVVRRVNEKLKAAGLKV